LGIPYVNGIRQAERVQRDDKAKAVEIGRSADRGALSLYVAFF